MDFLAPLSNSAEFDIYEAQTKALFIAAVNDLYAQQVVDVLSYGTPTYATQNVLEQFTKQVGLVVLRRPSTSHMLMRILYENWMSLPSKRGLAFLRFALELLWFGEWEIVRLWHPIDRLDEYPNLVTEFERPNTILTSRIYVLMSSDIDVAELETLAPSLQRLVPANIVPEIGIRVPTSEMQIGMACATEGFQFGYFIPENW